MRDEAKAAVKSVEEATGIPVLVAAEATLPTMAVITPAAKGAPAHILKYHPKFAAIADYLIANQCGFALRRILAPKEARFDLATTDLGREAVGRMVEDQLSSTGHQLPSHVVSGLRKQILEGLLRQLRSVPVGLRVDAWVRREYPGLNAQQEESIRLQLVDNLQTLAPDIKKLTPPKIFEASVSMSAAFAAYWQGQLSDPTIIVPYKISGCLGGGERLLQIASEIPDEPANDRQLIEAWGEQLHLTGWFRLNPVEA